MQKKIIALAVAGLVSGAAFAQSNVTVYGIADVGFQYSSDSYIDGVKSKSEIADGGQDGSRVGFKGTEDLGNGLSAFFQLETRFHLDTASNIEGRNSNVGLTSKNWGTIKLGSFGSVHDDYNGFSEAGGMGWGNSALAMLTTVDARNAIEYISPNFNGLEFKLGASTQYGRSIDDQVVQDYVAGNDNNRAIFGAVAYVNGPLKVAATYDRSKEQSHEGFDHEAASEWLLSGGYDFGVVKVGAGYDKTKFNDDLSRYVWRVAVGAPIGANDAVALSYSRSKWTDDAQDGSAKASGWGVSYSHAMSKRTNVYATYGNVSVDDELQGTTGLDGAGSYESAFKVGMRHFF